MGKGAKPSKGQQDGTAEKDWCKMLVEAVPAHAAADELKEKIKENLVDGPCKPRKLDCVEEILASYGLPLHLAG